MPRQRSVLYIVRADPTANAEFATGNTNENLVAKDKGRIRPRLAFAGLSIHFGPDDFASLGVERDKGRIRLMKENLAVSIGDATINRVAAHDWNDVRVLSRLIFPKNLSFIIQIECVDSVGERRMNVHDVADHQRRTFMTTKDAGRKCPRDLQLVDIISVDLIQFRIASIRVVASLHYPLF